MAGSIDNRLPGDLETLRENVLKAGVLNAKALWESAESHVANLGSTLLPSPDLDDASFQVVTSVSAFARLLYGQAQVSESEAARRLALATIDRLVQLASEAKPAGIPAIQAGAEAIS